MIYILFEIKSLEKGDGLATHEFGIINWFKENKCYGEYEPWKHDCIAVNDELLEQILIDYNEEFMKLETYFRITTVGGCGLNYCGVTLIPPDSLEYFCHIIKKANKHYKSEEIELLIEKIIEALRQGKYLIHYGI